MRLEPEAARPAHLPSTWKRLFAYWLDGVPLMIIFGIGTLPAMARGYLHESWPVLIAGWSFTMLYHICFLYYFGATPGKMLYGLRVISVQGGDLDLRQSIVRTLVAVVGSTVFSVLPQTVALFRPDRRQLADLAAGTQVVQQTARPHPPHPRLIIGSLLMLCAIGGSINTITSFNRYKISADGIELEFLPKS